MKSIFSFKSPTAKIKNLIKIILGFICTIFLIIFLILSIPVYIYRELAILLAKYFRPDFDGIVDTQSTAFLSDYFSERPSRSTIIVSTIFEGKVTCEDLKTLVSSKWINAKHKNGENIYKKFQQYPERWMGFTFWKKISAPFSIDKHVHKLCGDNVTTEDELTVIMEKLMNDDFQKEQSPWEFYVIENFKSKLSKDDGLQSAVITKIHHVLGDGHSIISAVVEGLFECESIVQNSMPFNLPQKSFRQKILSAVSLPFTALYELSVFASQTFKPNPWKIPDNKKTWHQLVARSDPIPIEVIKQIKTSFSCAFTSVLLSAVSSAFHKLENEKSFKSTGDSVLCLCPLPEVGVARKSELINLTTAAVFDLPTSRAECELQRLDQVDKIFQGSKSSIIPFLGRYYSKLLTNHVYLVTSAFAYNQMVGVAVANLPGLMHLCQLNGKRCIDSEYIIGGAKGEIGISVSILSHDDHIRIGITTEEGLLTKNENNRFLKYACDEIKNLHCLVKAPPK